jgi:hypothetical protein
MRANRRSMHHGDASIDRLDHERGVINRELCPRAAVDVPGTAIFVPLPGTDGAAARLDCHRNNAARLDQCENGDKSPATGGLALRRVPSDQPSRWPSLPRPDDAPRWYHVYSTESHANTAMAFGQRKQPTSSRTDDGGPRGRVPTCKAVGCAFPRRRPFGGRLRISSAPALSLGFRHL